MSISIEKYEKNVPPFTFHDEKYLQANTYHYNVPYLDKKI